MMNHIFWRNVTVSYRVWSREGIERLINLECVAYSAMTLLPYSDELFSFYQSTDAQKPVLILDSKFKSV